MEKKKTSLIQRFNTMFLVFIVAALLLSGTFSFVNLNRFYQNESRRKLFNVNKYLSDIVAADGDEFVRLKDYFTDHREEIHVPFDFNGDYRESRARYQKLFTERYPGADMSSMNPDDMDEDVRNAYYTYLYEYFLYYVEDVREAFQLDYTYIVFPTDEEKHTMCYFYDGFRDHNADDESLLMLGVEVEQDPAEHKCMWEAWNSGEIPPEVDVFNNEYGHVFSCCTPIIINGEKVAVMCSEVTVERVNSTIRNMTLTQCVVLFAALALCSGVMLSGIRSRVLSRILQLKGYMDEYVENKDVALAGEMEKKLDTIKTQDEIDDLAQQFSGMIVELDDYMHNLEKVTAERERIGAELNVATDIQASMLPRIFPAFPERDEFELYGTMDPAKEVGGDFYDFFMVDDSHLGMVIADVSGKGVPAALFMVIAKTLIKNHAQAGESVEEILYNSNNQLCEGNGAELFVTAWCGILDLRTGVLNFAEAGHENPVLLHQDGTAELLTPKRKRPPLAAMEEMRYLPNQVQLKEGDTLFLYTDGVPEATNANDELYGMERLEAFMPAHCNDEPKELLTAIRANVDSFVGEAPQFDDLTMLAMRIHRLGDKPDEA